MADATMSNVLRKSGKEIHAAWARDLASNASSKGRISASELEQQAREFIQLLSVASDHAKSGDISSSEFKPVRDFLDGVSRSRVQQGFSSDETASFIFSLKKPYFAALRADAGKDADALADQVWRATELLDALGLHTVKAYQKVARRSHQSPAARDARAVDACRETLGRHPGVADDRHAGFGAHAGGHGKPAAEGRRDRRADRHPRHHGRADRGHAGRAAPAEDGHRAAAHGRGMHHLAACARRSRRPSCTWAWTCRA